MTKMNELYKNSQIPYITDSFKDLNRGSELKGEEQRLGYMLTLSSSGNNVKFIVLEDSNGQNSILVHGTTGHSGTDASFELTFANPTNYLALDCFSSSLGYSRVVIYDKDGKPLHNAPVDVGTVVKYFGAGIHRAVYEGPVEEFGLSMRLISVTHGFAKIKGS